MPQGKKQIDEDYLFDDLDNTLSFKDAIKLYLKLFIPGYNIYLLYKYMTSNDYPQTIRNLFRAQVIAFAIAVGLAALIAYACVSIKPMFEKAPEELVVTLPSAESASDIFNFLEEAIETVESETEAETEAVEEQKTEVPEEEPEEEKKTLIIPAVYDPSNPALMASCSAYGLLSDDGKVSIALYNENGDMLTPEDHYQVIKFEPPEVTEEPSEDETKENETEKETEAETETEDAAEDEREQERTLYAVCGRGDYNGIMVVSVPNADSDHKIILSYEDCTSEFTHDQILSVYGKYLMGDIDTIDILSYDKLKVAGFPEHEEDLFKK